MPSARPARRRPAGRGSGRLAGRAPAGRRRVLGGVVAASLVAVSFVAVSLVVGALVVLGVVGGLVSGTSPSDEIVEAASGEYFEHATQVAEVAGEVERAGRLLDPAPAPASVDIVSPADLSVGIVSPADLSVGAGEAPSIAGVDRRGDGSPGFPSVRSDASGDFDPEGAGGSAALWPEWATCEFDDGRTTDPGVRSVVVDRDRQRSWFCEGVDVVRVFPVTTARSQPDPGVYEVYAKDMHTSSTFGGGYSTMTHFVAFTRGKFQGARVAFHSVPVYPGGAWVQPLESVGDLDRHGDSSGCIRALPADAEAIWDWLDVGGLVRVTT